MRAQRTAGLVAGVVLALGGAGAAVAATQNSSHSAKSHVTRGARTHAAGTAATDPVTKTTAAKTHTCTHGSSSSSSSG
jgi:hypothetical protein